MDKIQWDNLTKDDITIRFINGWTSPRDPKDHDQHDAPGGFIIGWSCKGFGFGELTFVQKGDGWDCDVETMSREFCMLVFEKFLETVGVPAKKGFVGTWDGKENKE